MKRYFLLSIIIIFAFSQNITAKIVDRIVAKVDGNIITYSDLIAASQRMIHESPKKVHRSLKKILNDIIDNKILEIEADRQKIIVTKKEVDSAINHILRRNHITLNQLKIALERMGTSLLKYREQIKSHIKKLKLINKEIKSKVIVNDELLMEYYKENIHKYKADETVKLKHILIKIPKGADKTKKNELLKKAKMIIKRLKQGESFEALAKKYSDDISAEKGGDIGTFKKGELLPEIDKEAFRLKAGQISNVIISSGGYHIIKVIEKRESGIAGFKQVKEQVKMDYIKEQTEKRFKNWLAELKKRSHVEIKW